MPARIKYLWICRQRIDNPCRRPGDTSVAMGMTGEASCARCGAMTDTFTRECVIPAEETNAVAQ